MTARSLLRTVMLVMRTVAAEMRRSPNPLAPPQVGMLMAIDAAPMTISQLARAQAVTLPTVSKAVEILVRQKLVARWVDKQDRRQTIVRLTPHGRHVLADTRHRVEEHIAGRLGLLSPSEHEELRLVMERLARILTTQGDGGCIVPEIEKAGAPTGRRTDRPASKVRPGSAAEYELVRQRALCTGHQGARQ